MAADALISCLCVTRNRVPLLRRAVQCFRNQTYANRELIVVFDSDDEATRSYVHSLKDTAILAIEVGATPRLTLGDMRNLSVRVARGRYIAQWDDDDWHGPARLREQLNAMLLYERPACVLLRWLMYDEIEQRAWLSHTRAWEGSLLSERSVVPVYPAVPKLEDAPVIERMLRENLLAGLDRPELYIYTYHGANTWERSHWENDMVPYCTPLGEADALKVRQMLHATR